MITDLKKILSEMELQKYSQKKQGSRILKAVRPAQ